MNMAWEKNIPHRYAYRFSFELMPPPFPLFTTATPTFSEPRFRFFAVDAALFTCQRSAHARSAAVRRASAARTAIIVRSASDMRLLMPFSVLLPLRRHYTPLLLLQQTLHQHRSICAIRCALAREPYHIRATCAARAR